MADSAHAMPDKRIQVEPGTISGAEYIAGVLKEEGVKQIIGFPASELNTNEGVPK